MNSTERLERCSDPSWIRAALPVVLASSIVWFAAACGRTPTRDAGGEDRPRNVILVVVDTLRADRLGCYGYPRDTTPNIDRWAQGATLYENNHAQGSWTVPSMLSMMSGLYVFAREERLPESPTLAERLRGEGFFTLAVVANRTLCGDRGFERGFDVFCDVSGPGKHARYVLDAFRQAYEEQRERIDEAGRFFAWIHLMDPHSPYMPQPQDNRFARKKPVEQGRLLTFWKAEEARMEQPGGPDFGVAARRMFLASNRYDGEVFAVDRAFGELVDWLDRIGELDETLVILAADHGELLYEKAHYPSDLLLRDGKDLGLPGRLICGHGKGWYFEEVWRTPLVIAGPGMPAGERRKGLAANLDIYPTILDALGLPPGERLQGQSLFGGVEPSRTHVFGHDSDTTAVLTRDRIKAIEHAPDRFLLPAEHGRVVELFEVTPEGDDEKLDPPPAEALEESSTAIAKWRRFVRRPYDSTVTDEDLRTLVEMGYVGATGTH